MEVDATDILDRSNCDFMCEGCESALDRGPGSTLIATMLDKDVNPSFQKK